MSREREREKKTWREIDRNKDRSFHAEKAEKDASSGKQNAATKEYRAALEALFQKKPEGAERIEKIMPTLVLPRAVENGDEAGTNRRQDLLRRVSAAQGSRAISDAIDDFLGAGHSLPDDQEIFLQMLEHRDEQRVREALERLERLLMGQLPKRKPVLVQRLRRIEEHAEEESTRSAAAQLRRKVA